MSVLYCICVFLLLLPASAAAQQATPVQAPVPGESGYTVFLGGQPIGREDVRIQRDAAGATTIVSTGRVGPPINLVTRRAEIRYRPNGAAAGVTVDAQLNGAEFNFVTSFADGSAVTTGIDAGRDFSRTDAVSADAIALPNLQFGAYEAIGRKLAAAAPGAEIHAYIVPQAEVTVRLVGVTNQQMQTGTQTFGVKRLDVQFVQPPPLGNLTATITVDDQGGLVNISMPAQSLEIVRDDVSSANARTLVYSNPGDEQVTIPANGFNLGATLTRPANVAAGTRLPAVILLAGSGVSDRDGLALGVPTLGELAGALANAGFLAVRYDKRGYGQSGGRAESATLQDFALDARGVFDWLRERRDVDPRRIAVLGHSEGAWVAMLVAARERRVAAVVSIAAPASKGSDLVVEQQRYALDQAQTPEAERASKIALQEKINAAVVSGTGWEGISPELRRQADTPWFQSFLNFDPATVVDDLRQPILFVHGALDKQVPVSHVDRLADLARRQSKSKSVEVVTVRGVNHLLTPAVTGDISEYGSLPDRHVSKDVSTAITAWLTKTLPASTR